MVNPMILCRQHLLGEHYEHHMFVGSLRSGRIKFGHYAGMLRIRELSSRHGELVAEMLARGYNHTTPLRHIDVIEVLGLEAYLESDPDWVEPEIDVKENERELWRRCVSCRTRMVELGYRFPIPFTEEELKNV